MTDSHIKSTLDEKPFGSLNGDEIERAESHIKVCSECKTAYDAARITSTLLHASTAETVEVDAFFKTRVLAAIRERRLSSEEAPLVRMWRAAGALVSAMAILLVILTGMTILREGPDSQVELTSQSLYSPEFVVLVRGDSDDDVADEQVVSTIYDLEDGDEQ